MDPEIYLDRRLEARLFNHFLFTLEGDYNDFARYCQENSHISFHDCELDRLSNLHVHFVTKLEIGPEAIFMDEGSYYACDGTYYEIAPYYSFSASFKSDRMTLVIESSSKNGLSFHIIMIFVRLFSDLLFLHGAAAKIDGKSVIFPAWGGAGKTNLLLALLNRGSRYIADDVVVVEPVSNNVLPFQKTLNLLHYNFFDNRDLLCHLDLKRRSIFYLWILLKRVCAKPFFTKLPIISQLAAYTEKVLRNRIGCQLEAHFVSKGPGLDKPDNVEKVFYLKRVNEDSVSIKTDSFQRDDFVQKMKICLDREKAEATNVMSRFPFASEVFRNALSALNGKEISKLQEFASKNTIQILIYGLKVQPEALIDHAWKKS